LQPGATRYHGCDPNADKPGNREVTVTRRADPLSHPKAREAAGLFSDGKLDRREFVRIVTLLGASAATAYALAGLPDPVRADEHGLPFPEPDGEAKPGGTLRIAMQVMPIDDPATYTWVQASNQVRHTLENLTFTGPDNITRPMLAAGWEAADDLRSWTFTLRDNIKWHNGETLTSEHIKWNFERWCDPKLGSSNISLSTFAAMVEETDSGDKDAADKPIKVKRLIPGAIEVVDALTIRLNLRKPVLSVPEDLYNYPTAILHPSFKPPVGPETIGTGPFRIASYALADHCTLARVAALPDGQPFDYWGGPVYLDEIHYVHFDAEFQLIAFAAGQVDAVYELGFEQLDYARSLDGHLLSAPSAQTLCCRFQIDTPPFDDVRVRQALVLAVDNKAVLETVFPADGGLGQNHHVAPIHPEYFELPALARDVEQTRNLLKAAGQESLTLKIVTGNTEGLWHQRVCEAIRDQLKEAGVRLDIEVQQPATYWAVWDKVPLGATPWTHRPLGTQALSLGYRSGAPWNETHFSSEAFDRALDEAETTLDPAERKAKMELVEKILQDASVMWQPVFRPVYMLVSKSVHGFTAHPTQFHQLQRVWVG
jgi:peptide/nickel transport system substrate-binding protein